MIRIEHGIFKKYAIKTMGSNIPLKQLIKIKKLRGCGRFYGNLKNLNISVLSRAEH